MKISCARLWLRNSNAASVKTFKLSATAFIDQEKKIENDNGIVESGRLILQTALCADVFENCSQFFVFEATFERWDQRLRLFGRLRAQISETKTKDNQSTDDDLGLFDKILPRELELVEFLLR